MRRGSKALALAVVPLLAVWTSLERPDLAAEPGQRQGCTFPAELERTTPLGFPPSGGGVLSDAFTRSIEFSPGRRRVKITSSELDPSTGAKELQTHVYPTSFDITDVTSIPGGRFVYVAGIETDTTCDDVVERWEFPRVIGGYEVEECVPAAPIGTPMGPYEARIVLRGGEYVPQAQRVASGKPSVDGRPAPAMGFPQKTELVRGSFGHFEDILADPENRYLLLRSATDHSLYKMPLVEPYALTLELAGASAPQLERVRTMDAFDLAGVGRFVWLSEILYCVYPPGAREAVLLDADNDGVFESFATYGLEDWDASPFGESLDWSVPATIDR